MTLAESLSHRFINGLLKAVTTRKKTPASSIDSLKAELHSINKALVDLNEEKKTALENLRNIETFDRVTVFCNKVITEAAFAKLFDKQAYSNLSMI